MSECVREWVTIRRVPKKASDPDVSVWVCACVCMTFVGVRVRVCLGCLRVCACMVCNVRRCVDTCLLATNFPPSIWAEKNISNTRFTRGVVVAFLLRSERKKRRGIR